MRNINEKKNPNFLIAIGQIKSPSARKQAFTNLQDLGASFPHVISPFSYFSSGSKLGDGSIVMHGAVVNRNVSIGKNCIIGAKALVTEGMEVPDGSMVLGVPAKIKKELTLEEQAIPSLNAHHYIENYKRYKAELG